LKAPLAEPDVDVVVDPQRREGRRRLVSGVGCESEYIPVVAEHTANVVDEKPDVVKPHDHTVATTDPDAAAKLGPDTMPAIRDDGLWHTLPAIRGSRCRPPRPGYCGMSDRRESVARLVHATRWVPRFVAERHSGTL